MKVILILLSLQLVACSGLKKVTQPSILGNWKVTDIQNVTLISDANANLNFKLEDSLAGSSSCNSYFGKYKVDGEVLSISQTGSTKKLCFGKLNNYEFLFFQSLPLVNRYEIRGNNLSLLAKDGKVIFKAIRD
ncbi:META domain-containing protein [Halobacteriovorax marinus]|nr:META domain-containing protein [Halobacteriovorax marinus]ATH06795.1 META domain-containing protein [Halobacteriovorax marinus]